MTYEFNSANIINQYELKNQMKAYLTAIHDGTIEHALPTDNEFDSSCFRISGINLVSRLYSVIYNNIDKLDDISDVFDKIKINKCLTSNEAKRYNKYLITQTLIENYIIIDTNERNKFIKQRFLQIIYPMNSTQSYIKQLFSLKIRDHIDLYKKINFVLSHYESLSQLELNGLTFKDDSDNVILNNFLTKFEFNKNIAELNMMTEPLLIDFFKESNIIPLQELLKTQYSEIKNIYDEFKKDENKLSNIYNNFLLVKSLYDIANGDETYNYDDDSDTTNEMRNEIEQNINNILKKLENITSEEELIYNEDTCDLLKLSLKNYPDLQRIFAFTHNEGLVATIPFNEVLKLLDNEFQEKFIKNTINLETLDSLDSFSVDEKLDYLNIIPNAKLVNFFKDTKTKTITIDSTIYILVGIARITRRNSHSESAICSNLASCTDFSFINVSDNISEKLDSTNLITLSNRIEFLIYENQKIIKNYFTDDVSANKYFLKYLKYKNKYLKLKQLLN